MGIRGEFQKKAGGRRIADPKLVYKGAVEQHC